MPSLAIFIRCSVNRRNGGCKIIGKYFQTVPTQFRTTKEFAPGSKYLWGAIFTTRNGFWW